MATEPSGAPDAIERLPRRPQHFAPYRLGRSIVLVLALIGVIAIALLVLGLFHVHVVTEHFRIH
jgi:hypothetical protein